MDLKSFGVGALVGALLLAGLVWVGKVRMERNHAESVAAANARAEAHELSLNKYTQAYEELATQHLASEDLLAEVRARNDRLAQDLERSEATVLSLQDQVSTLDAKLDSSRTTARRSEEDSTTIVVDLDEAVYLDGGGFVRVQGPVTVEYDPPSARSRLSVRGRFPVTVVLSRTERGDVRVDAFTGDPRLAIERIDVQRLAETPDAGTAGFLEGLSAQFTSASAWINRIVGGLAGYGACRATGG